MGATCLQLILDRVSYRQAVLCCAMLIYYCGYRSAKACHTL